MEAAVAAPAAAPAAMAPEKSGGQEEKYAPGTRVRKNNVRLRFQGIYGKMSLWKEVSDEKNISDGIGQRRYWRNA